MELSSVNVTSPRSPYTPMADALIMTDGRRFNLASVEARSSVPLTRLLRMRAFCAGVHLRAAMLSPAR